MHPSLLALALLLGGATLVWIASVVQRDVSLVDRFWGPAFVLVAAVFLAHGSAPSDRRLALFLPVFLWGIRLGIHLTRRNWGKGEDPRYTAFRRADPKAFWWKSLVKVFFLQAGLVFLISAPIQVAMGSENALGFGQATDYLGVALFLVGWTFEVVGDRQLAQHKSDPARRGKVLDTGLWGLTRHPNYFGDALLWWGFYCLALAAPGGLWTAPGPALMTYLLMEVSGARLLEEDLANRKPGYREYVARVPRFVPWPFGRAGAVVAREDAGVASRDPTDSSTG